METEDPIGELVEAANPESGQPQGPPLIQRLPLELLSEIFTWCLPDDDFHRPNKHEAPLLLAQVCTLWRKFSLNTPILWSSLEISTKRQNSEGGTSSLLLVDLNDLWLVRSRKYPLSLSFQGDCVRIDHFVLNTIRNHSFHLRHLKVTVPASDCIFLPDDLPLLETFEMFTEDSLKHIFVQSLCHSLTAAPRLQSFTWHNHLLHFLPVELKWSNLTRLKLNTAITLEDCLQMFSEAKAMTHITFGFIVTWEIDVDFSPIILPELQSLIICAGDDPGPIFDATTIPKLKELVVNSRLWPHGSILTFLRRSACPLESLNLYFPPVDEAQFTECLEVIQRTLREFTIHGGQNVPPNVTDTILERLTDAGTGTILCPKLEVIALYDCISCSPGQIAAMAQSRLKPANIDTQTETQTSTRENYVSCLKVIEMYENEAETTYLMPLRSLGLIVKVYSPATGAEIEMEPEDNARLRQLREEGLVMNVYEWMRWT